MGPLAHMISLLGEKWVLPIISILFMEEVRFNTMKKQLSITSRTLSRKLRKLENSGLVEKILDETGRTAYSLTEVGKEFYSTLTRILH